MLKFQLTPGDKYEGRCAEIFITEKQFMIYHCSVCEEIFTTFNELLSHITKDHYENAKEYKNEETANVEIQIIPKLKKEEVVVKEIGKSIYSEELFHNWELTNNSDEFTKVNDGQQNFIKNQNEEKCKMVNVTEERKEKFKEFEDLQCSLDSVKSSPQRKKSRIVTGMLKNNVLNRTKLNTLTRHQHLANNHIESKYNCGICGFAFKEKYNLRGHLLRHSNQKNFSCTSCSKKFFTKMELRIHEYRHKSERPYLCNHCGMGFVSSSSLTQHIKMQHNLHRAFKCELCDKAFQNIYQLKNHQPIHGDEQRSFQCSECLETFKIKKTLDNHVKIHENKSKLRCEYCDIGFGTDSAFELHRRNKHDIDDEYELLIEQHILGKLEKENELLGEEIEKEIKSIQQISKSKF